MNSELLQLAQTMIHELHRQQKLSADTAAALASLKGQPQLDFWNYLYPLRGLAAVEHRKRVPVSRVERLAAEPQKLELLAAGAGLPQYLSAATLQNRFTLEAAALGGAAKVVELVLPQIAGSLSLRRHH